MRLVNKIYLLFTQSYGEVMKHDIEKSIPQLIATYATRSNAEQAVLRGKVFKDKRLQVRTKQ